MSSGGVRRRLPGSIRGNGRPSIGYRFGRAVRTTARRVGQRAGRIGLSVGRSIRTGLVPKIGQGLSAINRAANTVQNINEATGGALELGANVATGGLAGPVANAVARGARRGQGLIRTVRRVGQTVERGSAALLRATGDQY